MAANSATRLPVFYDPRTEELVSTHGVITPATISDGSEGAGEIDLLPERDDVFDLGNSDARWAGLRIGTGGLIVDGTTTSAGVLTVLGNATFGDSENDTHTINGDVNITGDMEILGTTSATPVAFANNGSIVPTEDATYNIGSASFRWDILATKNRFLNDLVVDTTFAMDGNADFKEDVTYYGDVEIVGGDIIATEIIHTDTALSDLQVLGTVTVTGTYTATENITMSGGLPGITTTTTGNTTVGTAGNSSHIVDGNLTFYGPVNIDGLVTSGTSTYYSGTYKPTITQLVPLFGTPSNPNTNAFYTRVGNVLKVDFDITFVVLEELVRRTLSFKIDLPPGMTKSDTTIAGVAGEAHFGAYILHHNQAELASEDPALFAINVWNFLPRVETRDMNLSANVDTTPSNGPNGSNPVPSGVTFTPVSSTEVRFTGYGATVILDEQSGYDRLLCTITGWFVCGVV